MSDYKTALKTGLSQAATTTGQMKPLPGRAKEMVKNNAGGYGFKVDELQQALRFLILGCPDGYYKPGAQVALENVTVIEELLATRPYELLDLVESVFVDARAPKQDATLATLSLATKFGTRSHEKDTEDARAVRRRAWEVFGKLRTLSQVYSFQQYRGNAWGQLVKRSFQSWIQDHTSKDLLYQAFKYMSRNGWTFRDLLRCVHVDPRKSTPDMRLALKVIARGFEEGLAEEAMEQFKKDATPEQLTGLTEALEYARAVSEIKALVEEDLEKVPRIVELIRTHRFTWEFMPTWALKSRDVWTALLVDVDRTRVTMPMTALIRNLPTMTKNGVFDDFELVDLVAERLQDSAALKAAHVHPVQLYLAWLTYQKGRSDKGSSTWTPVTRLTNALEKGFYAAFGTLEPTGLHGYHAIDGSGSMMSQIAGLPCTAAQAVAVLAMCFTRSEKPGSQHFAIFSSGSGYGYGRSSGMHNITNLLTADADLNTCTKAVQYTNWGGTDCSLPVRKALEEFHSSKGVRGKYDYFAIYTDNETWAGEKHVNVCLEEYRKVTGIPAKLVVVATIASSATVADPKDPLSFEVVGFDTHAPGLVTRFLTDSL